MVEEEEVVGIHKRMGHPQPTRMIHILEQGGGGDLSIQIKEAIQKVSDKCLVCRPGLKPIPRNYRLRGLRKLMVILHNVIHITNVILKPVSGQRCMVLILPALIAFNGLRKPKV
jgi:hypothetical protein